MGWADRLMVLAAGVSSPSLALACATCSDPEDASNGAFLMSTIFLSLLPLAGIAGLAYGVWRHMNPLPESPPVSPR
jgi:hypothetical protein